MENGPSFFFSHARQDRETPGNYLRRFFDDLEIKLAQWAGINLEERRLGTIDARVPHGDNWDENLSRGLRIDNTFVAILTPLYFNRPNCGKELGVFLLRNAGLGIDVNGALTGVQNVLSIRWLPESAYAANTEKDSLIPPILRLIEDTPADDGRDAERTQAIARYRKKGMEKCVNVEPHYGELLDLLVARIRAMADLPPGANATFATAKDAFKYDWAAHLAAAGAPAAPPRPAAPPAALVGPRPLASVVAFYVTRRLFTLEPVPVAFADQLIAEARSDAPPPSDPVFAALLVDVRTAGVAEGFTVFHAASSPAVPTTPEPLLARLAALSRVGVLTALVVDPAVWPTPAPDMAAAVVETMIRSDLWTGPVLFPAFATPSVNVEELVAGRGLPPRIVALPDASEARLAALRRAFVDARGRVLQMSTDHAPDAERLPVLKAAEVNRG